MGSVPNLTPQQSISKKQMNPNKNQQTNKKAKTLSVINTCFYATYGYFHSNLHLQTRRYDSRKTNYN